MYKMKLVYFNGRGLAETSRIILALNDAKYEDFRYPLKIIDWATHNMERAEFLKDKSDNKLLMSLNKLPFLEVDGEVLSQSKTIERFLGRKFNMMGDTDISAGRIDALCEYVRDFKDVYQSVRKLPEDEKVDGLNKWFNETLLEKLELLENILCNEHEHFSVGTRISLADVVLYAFITQFFDDKEVVLKSTKNSPKLRKIVEYVGSLDQIKSWIKRRPETNF
tara:strand:- start:774 stop:1439 length:666 start_codon:yes stop_codon:yes gene_type:complete